MKPHDDTEARRTFFRGFLRDALTAAVREFNAGAAEVQSQRDLEDFFESYESSYALTLNYPDEILIETARKEGIPVEGREKIDIARDLFQMKKENDDRP